MVDKEVRRSLDESILTQSIEDRIEDGERHVNEAVNANVAALPLFTRYGMPKSRKYTVVYKTWTPTYRILGKSGSS